MKGKMKKLLSLILAIMMVVGAVQVPAKTVEAAEDVPDFEIYFTDLDGNTITEAEPGDQLKAIVKIVDGGFLSGLGFDVLFDTSKAIHTGIKNNKGTLIYGGFSNGFRTYKSTVEGYDEYGDEIGLTTLAEYNAEDKSGSSFVYIVTSETVADWIKEGYPFGTIDLMYMNLTVSEECTQDIPFDLNLTLYGADPDTLETPNKVVLTETLKIKIPEVPMTGISLNKSELAFDLSSDKTSEKLNITYTPNNTTDDKSVTWESNNTEVATVSADGTVTAVGKGTATITATSDVNGELTDSCTVTVTKSVTKVELDTTEVNLSEGQTEQLTATVTPADANNTRVTWSSSNDELVTVDQNGLVKAVGENGTAVITAETSNGKKATCTVNVVTKHLSSIKVSKADLELAKDASETLGLTYDPNKDDVTDTISDPVWTSSKSGVATVDQNGKVTAVASGTTTITVSVTANGKEFTDSCEVSVYTPVTSLALDKDTIAMDVKESETVTVTLNPAEADRYELVWSTDKEGIVKRVESVDKKSCEIIGLADGNAKVTVTDTKSGKTATVEVTVDERPITKVEIAGAPTWLYKGNEVTATATVTPADTTDDTAVTWESSDTEVLTVDQNGKIVAVGGGEATITVTSNARPEVTDSVTIEVEVPATGITIGEGNVNLMKGETYELKITPVPEGSSLGVGGGEDWSSSNEEVATVENGVVTAVGEGTATITASLGGFTAERTIVVKENAYTGVTLDRNNETVDLAEGTVELNYSLTKEDASLGATDKVEAIEWKSSNPEVATVEAKAARDVNAGAIVTLVGPGTATITVDVTTDAGDVHHAEYKVTVVVPATGITISESGITLKNGQSKQLTATVTPDNTTDGEVTWTSSDKDVAVVTSDENGKATVKAVADNGTAVITATTANGKKATCTVTVATVHLDGITLNKPATSIAREESETLTITYNPTLANVTDEVSAPEWKSSNTEVATVENGVVTAVGKGPATITATVEADGKEFTATCEVTVFVPVKELTIAPMNVEVLKGEEITVNVTMNPVDADHNLEWSANTANVQITPSADGKSCVVKGISEGLVAVTVEDTETKEKAVATVTVKEIKINAVNVTAEKTALNKGETTTVAATVLPANTTDEDKTVTWASSNTDVATVAADGTITAVGGGTATITATSNARKDVVGSIDIAVSVPLESISLGDGELDLKKGQTSELAVTYNPADTTVDKTVTWSSDDETVATVVDGTVTALKEGTATITATVAGKTATKVVNVEEISITGIALNPASKTYNLKEGTVELELIQNTENNDLTTDKVESVTWKSSNTEVATVEDGVVTLKDKGTATITVEMKIEGKATPLTATSVITVVIPVEGVKVTQDGSDVTGTTIGLLKGNSLTFAAEVVPANTSDDYQITWASADPTSVAVENGVVTVIKESASPVDVTATVKTADSEYTATVKISATEKHIESISLDKTNVTLEAGEKATLKVTYNPADTTDAKEIQTWVSSNPSVATVEDGVVTAVAGGTAKITATTANGKSATCEVKVPIHITGVAIEKDAFTVTRGDEVSLADELKPAVVPSNTDDDKTITYTLKENNGVVELKDGKITALKAGTAVILVDAPNAYTDIAPAECVITVEEKHLEADDVESVVDSKDNQDINVKEDGTIEIREDAEKPAIKVEITDEDVTDDVEVTYSSDSDIISVDEDGNISINGTGKATITVVITAHDGNGKATVVKEVKYTFEVYKVALEGIEFAPESKEITMTVGDEKQLEVLFTPADTTEKALVWLSSDPSVASVDANGKVTALKPGVVTITAESMTGEFKAETTVTVKAKPVDDDTNKPGNKPGTAVDTGDSAQPVTFAVTAILAIYAIFEVLRRKFKITV